MVYAATTDVPVDRSRAQIETLIRKRQAQAGGTDPFAMAFDGVSDIVTFGSAGRIYRFTLTIPAKASDQVRRSLWRSLLLVIKAKLESVDSGIETMEQAFFAQTVLPSGATVYDETRESVAAHYLGGVTMPLLPPPRRD